MPHLISRKGTRKKIKHLHKAHVFVGEHFSLYKKWHEHPHHHKVHVSAAVLYSVFVAAMLVNTIFVHNFTSKAAETAQSITTKEDWEAGTLTNADTEDNSGDLKIASSGSWGGRALKTPPNFFTYGSRFTSDGTYIYALRGNYDNAFYKFSPSTNTWTVLEPAPLGAYAGSALEYDGNGTIYAFFGNVTKQFYSYSIANNTWTRLDDMMDTVSTGSDMVWANNYLWLVRSQGTQDFWKFDPSAAEGARWSTVPYGLPATVANASSVIYDGSRYIYTLRGNSTTTWYRFDTTSPGNWSTMTTTYPAAINEWIIGDYYNGSIYYAHPNSTTIYKCTVSDLTCSGGWLTMNAAPATVRYAGFQTHGSGLYLFRGNSTFDFWRFDPSSGASGAYDGTAMYPQAITTGGDLIYDSVSGYTYGFKGGAAANGFYYYDPTTNAWASRTTTGMPAFSYDTKGTKAGNYLYMFTGNATTLNRYDTTNDSGGWSNALATAPLAVSNGAGLTYNSTLNSDLIFASRGNGTNTIYAYSIGNNNWTTFDPADLPSGANVNVGSRIVASDSNIFLMLGNGSSRFFKYTYAVGGGSWTEMKRTPFAPYYGSDLTYYNGKIYALAGNYRKYLYEYNITTDTWRKLSDMRGQYQYELGSYNGASIEYIGGTSLMVSRGAVYSGNSLANQEIMNYSIGANSYLPGAEYISPPYNLTFAESWISLTSTVTTPGDSSVAISTRSSDDAATWSDWQALSGQNIQSPSDKKYIQVKIALSASSDGSQTPVVSAYAVNYNSDETAPSNPSSITAYSQEVGGSEIQAAPNAYSHTHPYFSWPEAGQSGGASDAGSGVAGYYVYFGSNSSGSPVDDGFYTTDHFYNVNEAVSSGDNYLRISTKDNAGKTAAATTLFQYSYNGISPANTLTKTSTADFTSGTLSSVASASDQLKLSGKNGFWREYRLSSTPATLGYGSSYVYKSSTNKLYVARGNNSSTIYSYDIATDTWSTLTSTGLGNIYYGGGLVDGPGNYIYAARGGGSNSFYRYNITNDAAGWSDSDAEDAPTGCFTYGGYMIYDNSHYIYAFKGGDDAFYRFDPLSTADGEWTQKANINFGYPDQTSSNNAGNGAVMTFDGNNTIYAIQAGSLNGFTKYSITGNSWTPITRALPIVAGAGANLVWDSINSRLLYMPGNNLRAMYAFNVSTNEWTVLPSTPSYLSYGAFSLQVGNYLYLLRGSGTSSMYKFDIIKNSWFTPNNDIFGPSWYEAPQTTSTYFGTYAGSDLIKGDSYNLYGMRGNYDNKFIKYNSVTGTVSQMANIPAGTYQDASLVYDEDDNVIYAIVGSNELNFFQYSIANNSWTELTADPLKAAPSYGASLAYDGSRYIYYMRGNSTTWYRYDKTADSGSRWSVALPTTNFGGASYGSQIVYKDGYLYVMRGNNTNPNTLYRFDTTALPGGTWTNTLATLAAPVYYDGFMVDGNDGYLYVSTAGNSTTYGDHWWRYNISGNSWSQAADFPGQVTYGGAGAYNSNNKIFAFSGPGTDSFAEGIYNYTVQSSNSSFEESGSYISESLDLTSTAGKNVYLWGNIEIDYTTPNNTSLIIETQSSSDNSTWSSWASASQQKIRGSVHQMAVNSPLGRYLKIKISLASGDGYLSPSVASYSVSYYKDLTAPSNPSALSSAKTRVTDGSDISDSNWYNSDTPYFAWPEIGTASAAADDAGGSGIAGYYLYLGEVDGEDNCSGNPSTSSGLLTANEGSKYYQTATSYSVPTGLLSNGKSYCLRLATKDNAGNVQTNPWQAFKYRYETTAPENPSDLTANPLAYTNIDSFTFTITEDASDANSGLLKYQYQTGGDGSNWYDFDPALGTSVTIPNATHTQGKYRDGVNVFKIRAVDNAGNISSPIQTNYYFGSTAPSPPQNLSVNPSEPSSTNSFTFEWDPPATYVGDSSKIKYYYSINTEPNEYNTNYTSAQAAGPGPFATQRTYNSFYVVAKDEANNIDWKQFAKIEFYADTSAPSAPSYVNASDISDKEAGQYRIVVSWMAPNISDQANFAGYDIYESNEEDGEYEKIDRTTGTAYVDLNLEKDSRHYYKVYSVDKTGNASTASTAATAVATGRFTKPPNITKDPEATPHARSATISWNTSREANSAIEYGITDQFGETVGNKATDYVTDHKVTLGNLQPGTQYYYRSVFTDPDGNIGTSSTNTFITAPAPLVSGMKIEDITLNSMLISWESNVPSYGEIQYGQNSSYGGKVEEEKYFTTRHTVKLSDLESDTSYHFQVKALDEEGNIFNSDDYVESTLPLPKVSDVKVENLTNVEKPTMSISFKTNVETTTIVRYTAGGKQKEYLTSEYSKEHSFELDNLLPNTSYALEITGRDHYGNEAAAESHTITSLSDTMPPRIEKINDRKKIIGEGSDAEAQLTVKVTTSEPTTLQIEAAKGVNATDFKITSNVDGLNTDHSIVMKLGEAGSPYSYRIRAIDAAGNVTVSETRTLVLSGGNKTAFDYIVSVFSRSFSWLGNLF